MNIQSKNSVKECLIAIENLKRIKYYYKIQSRNCLYNIRIHFIPIIIIVKYGIFVYLSILTLKLLNQFNNVLFKTIVQSVYTILINIEYKIIIKFNDLFSPITNYMINIGNIISKYKI